MYIGAEREDFYRSGVGAERSSKSCKHLPFSYMALMQNYRIGYIIVSVSVLMTYIFGYLEHILRFPVN